eukprot:TRINITY_DN4063_c0_g1_i1.p1 TRINITY_DN4063_c0_g1~~TRINITY_DN4063_c0_g1_i1.p1  ORF type:complete len:211 (+),score=30.85 TRINITY_DN4063_c0_g1_i1:80-712(+)
MVSLASLTFIDKKPLWDKIGFSTVEQSDAYSVRGTTIFITESGTQGWGFTKEGCDKEVTICGIKTAVKPPSAPVSASTGCSGPASGIDHVVVHTTSLADFKEGFREHLGVLPRRGPVTIKGRNMLFYLLTNTVLEVVEIKSGHTGIWGVTFTSKNATEARKYIHERGCSVSPARVSYQNKERFIFTIREHVNGMKTPVAFIDERKPRSKM